MSCKLHLNNVSEARPIVGGRWESLESRDPEDLMPRKDLIFELWLATWDEGNRSMRMRSQAERRTQTLRRRGLDAVEP